MHRLERLAAGVQNSVHWYEALCEAHGVPGERHPSYWVNRGTMPPYMSNLVTTAGADAEPAQLEAIDALIAADDTRSFSIKDAYQCLDLTRRGFGVLFHATWIFLPPSTPAPPVEHDALEWSVARGVADLALWEQTWRGIAANGDAHEQPRVFLPRLLERPDFQFLLGRRADEPLATAALNRSGDVIGLSNVFSDREPIAGVYASAVRAARALHPTLPFVGYDRDAHLAAALEAGFEAGHGLTVWNRERPRA